MQSNLIKLYNGEKFWITTKETLIQLPYFQSLFDNINANEIFIDLNSQDFDNILEYLRGAEYYQEIYLLDRDFDPNDLKIVEINIGNQIFKTTMKTICKAMYFNAFFIRWNGRDKTDFIDRSPDNFKRILSYLRNPKYILPHNLNHDLNFYCIDIPKYLQSIEKKESENIDQNNLVSLTITDDICTLGCSSTEVSGNVAIGFLALSENISGSANVAVGYNALQLNTGGNNNTAIGTSAGNSLETGTNNIIIGNSAGVDVSTRSGCIIIDSAQRITTVDDNNQIFLATGGGNFLRTDLSVGGAPDAATAGLSITINGINYTIPLV